MDPQVKSHFTITQVHANITVTIQQYHHVIEQAFLNPLT